MDTTQWNTVWRHEWMGSQKMALQSPEVPVVQLSSLSDTWQALLQLEGGCAARASAEGSWGGSEEAAVWFTQGRCKLGSPSANKSRCSGCPLIVQYMSVEMAPWRSHQQRSLVAHGTTRKGCWTKWTLAVTWYNNFCVSMHSYPPGMHQFCCCSVAVIKLLIGEYFEKK